MIGAWVAAGLFVIGAFARAADVEQVDAAATRYRIPLVAIDESSGARGPPCGPFGEHGFAGAEAALMQTIDDAVRRGVDGFPAKP